MKRAVYDKQFKMAAVKLAQESDKSVTQTATELGISGCSLRRWINEYDEYGESAFPGHGNALFNYTNNHRLSLWGRGGAEAARRKRKTSFC